MRPQQSKRREGGIRGFTVIEAIMSFTILALAFAGFSTMIVTSLKNFRASQERYIAAKIAQEGIELVLNKKESHIQCVIANPSCPITNWQQGLIGSFQVDVTRTNDLRPGQSFQTFNPSSYICIIPHGIPHEGKFSYCGSNYLSPKYTRRIIVNSVNAHTARVRSIVSWYDGQRSLTLESMIYGR